mmetsp:Transcript_25681/g.64676  ORF Transcript_25681/g.64676 Transcript_25681/m.64676 type:complete len:237 (+) Transcript_25681:1459-2169(+)
MSAKAHPWGLASPWGKNVQECLRKRKTLEQLSVARHYAGRLASVPHLPSHPWLAPRRALGKSVRARQWGRAFRWAKRVLALRHSDVQTPPKLGVRALPAWVAPPLALPPSLPRLLAKWAQANQSALAFPLAKMAALEGLSRPTLRTLEQRALVVLPALQTAGQLWEPRREHRSAPHSADRLFLALGLECSVPSALLAQSSGPSCAWVPHLALPWAPAPRPRQPPPQGLAMLAMAHP